MSERQPTEASTRRLRDVAEQLRWRGRQRGGERRVAVTIGRASANEKLLMTSEASGSRGLVLDDRSRGSDGPAAVLRDDTRHGARSAEIVRAWRGGLRCEPQQQRNE
jgi:hypothetical protein